MRTFSIAALLLLVASAGSAQSLTGTAADLYAKALREGDFTSTFQSVSTEVKATSDNRSFYIRWQKTEKPTHWLVLIHGAGNPAHGFATDEFATWLPYVRDRDMGVISLQWWFGTGNATSDFYTPDEIYREVSRLLEALRIEPNTVMLQGFSRGSTQTYALKAIDKNQGRNYFALMVASSGCMNSGYPPNITLMQGGYGENPLVGSKWVTSAGARDTDPNCDGVTGMRATGEWLVSQGAQILKAIEDPSYGHGALVLNGTNARMVLDLYFDLVKP